jgi:hypothetical protein
MARYIIAAFDNADLTMLSDTTLAATDDAVEAQILANKHSNYAFGSGITDTQTGLIDCGFGFGVSCPDDDA